MKIKKNTKFFLVATIIAVILYILLAAQPMNKEYQFIPEWTKDISKTEYSTVSKDEPTAFFKLGQSAGYFTSEGEILSSITFPYKISISDSYYSTYSSDANDIPYYDNYGEKKGTLNTAGFPFFDENRIYVFLPGGSSVSMFNEKSNLVWTNENVIPITAFASSTNLTAAGYANGTITLIDNSSGMIITEFSPDGSDNPSILGLDISKDGKYTACISGHNKQRFIITETVENRQKVIFHKYLDDDLLTRTLIKFYDNSNQVLYVYKNGIGVYDIKHKKDFELPISDNIISIKETGDMIFLLGKTNRKYTVYAIEKSNSMLGQFSFEADTAFIQTLNNNFYIGKDNKLSKILIKKD